MGLRGGKRAGFAPHLGSISSSGITGKVGGAQRHGRLALPTYLERERLRTRRLEVIDANRVPASFQLRRRRRLPQPTYRPVDEKRMIVEKDAATIVEGRVEPVVVSLICPQIAGPPQ